MNTRTLAGILRERAASSPDSLGYIYLNDREEETARLTYRELDRAARAAAAQIRERASVGDRALLLYPSGPEFLIAFFGCLYAGIIAVPAPASHQRRERDRLGRIVRDCGARLVLGLSTTKDDQDASALAGLDHLILSGEDVAAPDIFEPSEYAYLQYTSGSTSVPKGVIVTQSNLHANCGSLHDRLQHSSTSVVVSWLPHFHDMGLVYGLMVPLYGGGSGVIMSPAAFVQRPVRWLRAFTRYRGTHTAAPNFAYDLCVKKIGSGERGDLDLASWMVAINGAEPVRRRTIDAFSAAFGPCGFRRATFCPGYGLAEATLCVSLTTAAALPAFAAIASNAKEPQRAGAEVEESSQIADCGPPADSVDVAIVDPDTGEPRPEGAVGEIWVTGPAVTPGYWGHPAGIDRASVSRGSGTDDRYLRTGDLGFVRGGHVHVTGRLKDLIIVRGGNYYPQDIEETVEGAAPMVHAGRGAAFGLELPDGTGLGIVYEIRREERKRDTSETLEQIRRAVSDAHGLHPHSIVLVQPATIPLTPNGKIMRQVCRQRWLKGELEVVARWDRDAEAGRSTQAAGSRAITHDELTRWLEERIARVSGLRPSALESRTPFAELGLESKDAVEISAALEDLLGLELSPALLYDHPTIAALVGHVIALTNGRTADPSGRALSRGDRSNGAGAEAIAVIGIGCRFPHARGADEFWKCLTERRCASDNFPPDRGGTTSLPPGGFLDRIDEFDAYFFGISPDEASQMDPQQRLSLEVCYEALEHAAIPVERLAGTRAGVYVGVAANDFARLALHDVERITARTATGLALSVVANRISYAFDLRGPSVSVDTACSSSLVAVHLASRALRGRECDLALAGGVNLILAPELTLAFLQSKMLAPDGRCKTFDASANGYARGEGVGFVVLKRLSDALRDGDRIHAVVRGSAVNQDGRSNGLTAPNGLAQRELLRLALADAGVKPADIGYLEAHGTGTALGDPIEVEALTAVLDEGRIDHRCYIGSAKASLGHAEAAAGITGLIRAVLILSHELIPGQPHFSTLNPRIPLPPLFQITPDGVPWPRGERARLAGVSSFGFSGTNAHVVLEEAPVTVRDDRPSAAERPAHILVLSGKTAEGLRDQARSLSEYLAERHQLALPDICFTANTGRSRFDHRLAAVAGSSSELASALAGVAAGDPPSSVATGPAFGRAELPLALVFPGQGALHGQSFRPIYDAEPAFHDALNRCATAFAAETTLDLIGLLFGDHEADLFRSEHSQAALFALEYSLERMWRSWGLVPRAVLGHSAGEYAAACAAGVFGPEDGIALTVARGRLMTRPECAGAMAALACGEAEAARFVRPYERRSAIAAVNGPSTTVIAGDVETVDAIERDCRMAGISTRRLPAHVAFHSPLVRTAADEFSGVLSRFEFRVAGIPLVNGVTGSLWERGQGGPDADYWCRHMREPVRYQDGIGTLVQAGVRVFLEVGPDNVLATLGRRLAPDALWLSTCDRRQGAWDSTLRALQHIAIENVRGVDWHAFDRGRRRRRLPLPPYTFARQRYPMPSRDQAHGIGQRTPREGDVPHSPSAPERAPDLAGQITATLVGEVAQLLGAEPSRVEPQRPYLELGADSLVLIELLRRIQSRYGITIPLRTVFDELTTIERTAIHLARQLPDEQPRTEVSSRLVEPRQDAGVAASPNVEPGDRAVLERVIAKQLDFVRDVLSNQLATFATEGRGASTDLEIAPSSALACAARVPEAAARSRDRQAPYVAYRPAGRNEAPPSDAQQRYLERLRAGYGARTRKSKHLATRFRRHHADMRSVLGLRRETKELQYPLVVERSAGSKFWDVDGNEYVDFTMGFGVNLFGHNPEFVRRAIASQLEQGLQLGPLAWQVGDTAEAIARLTGLERVFFCNSGTEAVMNALRLARAASGRPKIVTFAGAYHGSSDGVLALGHAEDPTRTVPMARGIPDECVANTIVLPYGEPEALQRIREHAGELGAVLVEPVQSRRPELQPAAFLRSLRALCDEIGAALIFDEVITGFRIQAGGAQAWFGVQADLACYGKILGGGMPIGVVAGSRRIMDVVDGGDWTYGDDSYPSIQTSFLAGTFCKHPLAIAAASAVLRRIDTEGPELYHRLNRSADDMVRSLNDVFTAAGVPVRTSNFGSLFRFSFGQNHSVLQQSLAADLFFFRLAELGIYIWEGRTTFLSTAHDSVDIERLIAAARVAVRELTDARFLEERLPASPGPAAATPASPSASAAAFPLKLALTDSQRQIWFLSNFDPVASLGYNTMAAVRVSGALNGDAIRAAWQAVIDRHEALRTSFSAAEPVQFVHEQVSADVQVVTLDHAAAVDAWLEQEAHHGFDLTRPSLARLHVLLVTNGDPVLVVVVHHLVADGWSLGVLLHELAHEYNVRVGAGTPHDSVPMQLSSYNLSIQQREQSERMRTAEVFWLERFDGLPPPTGLPSNRRGAVSSFEGNRVSTVIGRELLDRCRALGNRHGLTLFATLIGGFAALVARLTDRTDIVVSTPVADRPEAGDRLIANTINVLPVRFTVPRETRASDYLQGVWRAWLDAHEHAIYPFPRLVKRLNMSRDTARMPLTGVMFNLDRPYAYPRFAGSSSAGVPAPMRYVQMELELNITQHDDRLELDWIYQSGLFERSTIERWAEEFAAILDHVTTDEHADIRSGREPFVPFHTQFERQVSRTPRQTAIVDDTTSWTYDELNRRANQIARAVMKSGARPEAIVAVAADRGAHFAAALIAILKSGRVYLPLDTNEPSARVTELIRESGCQAVIAPQARLALLTLPPETNAISLESTAAESDTTNLDRPCPPAQLAYVIYTSGSTGRPKGAMVEHRGMANHLRVKCEELKLESSDRVAQTASQCFDISVWQFLAPLMVGGTVVVADSPTARQCDRLIEWVEAKRITVLEVVPSLLGAMLQWIEQKPIATFEHLRWLMSTGEMLAPQLCREWLRRYPRIPIVNAYGPTECSDDVTHCFIGKAPAAEMTRVPIGHALPGVDAYVLDENGHAIASDAPGEICLGGECVGRGYLNSPALTAERFVPDPFARKAGARMYRTGDVGRRTAEGDFEYLGRVDRQMKVRGFRIEPGEIEAVLCEHEGVEAAAVMIRKADGRNSLIAYVAANDVSARALRDHARGRLPDHMVPDRIGVVPALPLTPNGKIDHAALSGMEIKEEATDSASSMNAVERRLARIWADVLAIDHVGVDENFFELGGDSILSVQIAARARDAGISLTPRDLFSHQTISGLARVVQPSRPVFRRAVADDRPRIPAVVRRVLANDPDVEDVYPLSPVQHGLLFHSLWGGRTGLYVQQLAFTLAGPLDAARFTRAWTHVANRHPALRTRFMLDGSIEPLQIVERVARVPWTRADWSALTPRAAAAAVDAYMEWERVRPFDLTRAPLMRVGLIRTGPDRHEFVWTHHHAVLDGWSVVRVLDEVWTAYSMSIAGQDPDAAARPAFTFRQYVEYLQQQDMESAAEFWRSRLAGCAWTPLPAAASADERQAGYLVRTTTFADLWPRVRAFAATHHLTPATLFQAAWALTLSGATSRRDVLFGTVVSGRPADLAGVESLVGTFINVLPVRVSIDCGDDTLRWLRTIQEKDLASRQYDYLPLARIADASGGVPLSSIDTLLVIENFPMPSRSGGAGVTIENIRDRERTDYPIEIQVSLAEPSIRGIYDGQRFDASSIDRLLARYQAHLAALVEEANAGASARVAARQQPAVDNRRRPTPGPTEAMVMEILSELIDGGEIGESDDFFERGGHSLTAMQAITRINGVFNLDLPVSSVFDHPTASALGHVIRHEMAAASGIADAGSPATVVAHEVPLSYAQQRIWLAQQMDALSPAYNQACSFSIRGELNVAALKGAVERILARHDVLRTAFPLRESGPVQEIVDAVATPVQLLDFSGLHPLLRQSAAAAEVERISRMPFDLSRPPLIRFVVSTIAPREHVVAVIVHHVVFDEWSEDVLVSELSEAYNALCDGQAWDSAPPGFQYRDYALGQNSAQALSRLAAHKGFWTEYLAGYSPRLHIPAAPDPSPAASGAVGFAVPPELAATLQQIARLERSTSFALYLACYATLIHCWTGEDDVLIAVPFTSRGDARTHGLIGCFMNTVPVRIGLRGNPRFREIVARTRQAVVDVLPHADVPWQIVVDAMGGERAGSDVLPRVAFGSRTRATPVPRFGASAVSTEEIREPGARFDLTTWVDAKGADVDVTWTYRPSVLGARAIDQAQAGLFGILAAAAQDCDTTLSAFRVVFHQALEQSRRDARDVPRVPRLPRRTLAGTHPAHT